MKRDDIMNLDHWQFRSGREIDNCVPDHWLPVIAALCASIGELVNQDGREHFCWRDIKEKHGQLAVYYVATTELTAPIEALVDVAESACSEAAQAQPAKASDKRFLG